MDKETYNLIENYMLLCMEDSAHDKEHIYRVLYNSLEIAKTESNIDYDVLICSCLLHDIARKEQFENPSLCHAIAGAGKAYKFLASNGFGKDYAEKVKHCIQTHRFRSSNPPVSIEAKILFDADKLDVAGAIGIARTLVYKGIVSEPLYSVLPAAKFGVAGNAFDVSGAFTLLVCVIVGETCCCSTSVCSFICAISVCSNCIEAISGICTFSVTSVL